MEIKKERGLFKEAGVMKGAMALSISAILVKLVGVAYKIPLSYLLGDEGMGYFNSAYTVFGFFYILLSSGIPKGIAMVVSEYETEKEEGISHRIYLRLVFIFSIIGIGVTSLLLVLSPMLCRLILGKRSLPSVLVVMPSLIFISLSGVARGYLNGKMKLLPIALSQIIEAVLKVTVGLGAAYLGVKLRCGTEVVSALALLGITVSSLASSLFLLTKCKSRETRVKTGQSSFSLRKRAVRDALKLSLPITLSSSVIALSGVIDMSIITRGLRHSGLGESAAAAAYGNYTTLVFPMLTLVISVVAPFSAAYLPRLRQAAMSENSKKLNGGARELLGATLFFAAPSAFFFSFYSLEILDVLFLNSSAALAAPLLVMLAPSVILLSVLGVANTLLEATGKVRLSLAATLVGVIIKLLSGAFLVANKSFGLTGAPISSALSYSVSLLLCIVFLSSGKNSVRLLAGSFKTIFVAFISIFLPYFVKISIYGSKRSIGLFFVFGIVSAVFYLVFSLFLSKSSILLKKNGNSIQKEY